MKTLIRAFDTYCASKHGTSEHYKKILSTVGFEQLARHDLQVTSPPS